MANTGHLMKNDNRDNHLTYYEDLPGTVRSNHIYYAYGHPDDFVMVPPTLDDWPGLSFIYWVHPSHDGYWMDWDYNTKYCLHFTNRIFTRQGNTNVWLCEQTSTSFGIRWCDAAIRMTGTGFEYTQYIGPNASQYTLSRAMDNTSWSESDRGSSYEYRYRPVSPGGMPVSWHHFCQRYTSPTLFGTYTYVGSCGYSTTDCYRRSGLGDLVISR